MSLQSSDFLIMGGLTGLLNYLWAGMVLCSNCVYEGILYVYIYMYMYMSHN